jgi:hypothetical protein
MAPDVWTQYSDFTLLRQNILDLENETRKLSLNDGHQLPSHKPPHPRRMKTSTTNTGVYGQQGTGEVPTYDIKAYRKVATLRHSFLS